MQLISEAKLIYRNFGQGVLSWLVAFSVLVTVAVVGYGIAATNTIMNGALPASPPDLALPIAWLASVLALLAFMEISDKIQDNYRKITHERRVNQGIRNYFRDNGMSVRIIHE